MCDSMMQKNDIHSLKRVREGFTKKSKLKMSVLIMQENTLLYEEIHTAGKI